MSWVSARGPWRRWPWTCVGGLQEGGEKTDSTIDVGVRQPRAAPHKCSCDACGVPCWAQRLHRHRKLLHSAGAHGQGWAGEGGTRVTRQLGRGSDGTKGNPSTDQVGRYLGRHTFCWKIERPPVRTAVSQFIPTPTSVTCSNLAGESCRRRRNKSPIVFSKKHTPPSLTKRKTGFPNS